jgi:multidrug resistance efflux pump
MLAAGVTYYLAEEPYVSTDDAFVRAAKESINARVAGQVVDIAVKDNQPVTRSQLLFQIDPQPYRIAVDQAAARLDGARLQINQLKATYRQQVDRGERMEWFNSAEIWIEAAASMLGFYLQRRRCSQNTQIKTGYLAYQLRLEIRQNHCAPAPARVDPEQATTARL